MQPENSVTEGAGEARGAEDLEADLPCPLCPHCPLLLVAPNIPIANPNLDLPVKTPAAGRTSLANPSRGRRSRWSAMTVFTMRATSGTGRDSAISARVASNAVP